MIFAFGVMSDVSKSISNEFTIGALLDWIHFAKNTLNIECEHSVAIRDSGSKFQLLDPSFNHSIFFSIFCCTNCARYRVCAFVMSSIFVQFS